jgi:hypothetical protein
MGCLSPIGTCSIGVSLLRQPSTTGDNMTLLDKILNRTAAHDRPYVSANWLARRLSVSHTSVCRWIEQGLIHASRLEGSRGRYEISLREAARVEETYHAAYSGR